MKRLYLSRLRGFVQSRSVRFATRPPGHRGGLATAGKSRSRCHGFTLAEMMIAVAIFIMVIVAAIYIQIFGLEFDEICNSKMGATELARTGFDDLMNDIRGAKIWLIGSGGISNSYAVFTPVANMATIVGNALQLFPSPTTNSPYILYYFDTNTACSTNAQGRLCRLVSTNNNQIYTWKPVVQYLTNTTPATTTNSMFFHAENYMGQIMNDYQYKYVIVTTMEFSEYQFPTTKVGSNQYFNYYRMRLKATSHCPN
ncbi:conserved hypothetical protein [Verrucomicrobia bacterium]|nr:conserved hypothetical protein [Verrucomicrobiota bacterium]